MKSEIKAKWVEALRSGKYKQGRGLLRTPDNEYCCLGVLCDLAKPDGWTLYRREGTVLPDDWKFSYDDKVSEEQAFLPDNLSNEYEILSEHQDQLVQMNDRGSNFNQIADYIEKHV